MKTASAAPWLSAGILEGNCKGMNSCIYEGRVRHRRFGPVDNRFEYKLYMLYLDLAELPDLFKTYRLWSVEQLNLASFFRKDHCGNPAEPLEETIRNLVKEKTGQRPQGPIRLLTHLRYFGYCMNPVSFYYCWRPDESAVETLVAEVHNTPWGETHCYTLDSSMNQAKAPGKKRFVFPKDFHVSPFMGMHQIYDWRFTDPSRRLSIHMDNIEDDKVIFDATMVLERLPITSSNLNRVLWRYPFMTGKVIGAIYWQALKLWLKRAPYFSHPENLVKQEERNG
jgi:uncharacterized protein